MCVSSVVSDYYMRSWPYKFPKTPNVLTVADEETKKMLREVMLRLDQIDKKLGDVECMDEKKARWIKELGVKNV